MCSAWAKGGTDSVHVMVAKEERRERRCRAAFRSDGADQGPPVAHAHRARPSRTRPCRALAAAPPASHSDGSDADERVKTWKDQYFDPDWGEVNTARLNGPSGAWLRSSILDPLESAGAGSHFVTDCLTTYRLSTGAAARLNDTYEPMAKNTSGLRSADLKPHPSEAQIVREVLETQRDRLNGQIAAARPKLIVTLGNAASRVITSLAGAAGSGKLNQDGYGRPSTVTVSGVKLSWIALVHPATPGVWQGRHETWLSNRGFAF